MSLTALLAALATAAAATPPAAPATPVVYPRLVCWNPLQAGAPAIQLLDTAGGRVRPVDGEGRTLGPWLPMAAVGAAEFVFYSGPAAAPFPGAVMRLDGERLLLRGGRMTFSEEQSAAIAGADAQAQEGAETLTPAQTAALAAIVATAPPREELLTICHFDPPPT